MIFRIGRASGTYPHTETSNPKSCAAATELGGHWVIDLPDMDDLMGLIQEVGSNVIISEDEITIYDDYME